MKWTHLVVFITTLLMLTVKHKGYHNLGQTIHALIVVPLAMTMILLAIFLVKYNSDDWTKPGQITEVRAWIIIDCFLFFSYIISGVIFTTFAYIVKFNPTAKNEELLLMDDNPWNDKDTEDFLRHLKLEFFVFCYFLASAIMDIALGFFKGRDFGAGPKDWNPTQLILLLDLFVKINNILVLCVISMVKANVNDTKTRVALVFLALFDWTMLGVIFYLFKSSDHMDGQNMFCRLWVQT